LISLHVDNSNFLKIFSCLKSLREIIIINFDTIENIDEIFDPKKIIKLEAAYLKNAE
jgi:hypothetical protein